MFFFRSSFLILVALSSWGCQEEANLRCDQIEDNFAEPVEKITGDDERLSKFTYPRNEPDAKDLAELLKNGPVSMGELPLVEVSTVPQIAIKFGSGWLLGSSRGEWGGELMHQSDAGVQRKLLDDNIHDIFKLKQGYVVFSGLSHIAISHGSIHLLNLGNNAPSMKLLHKFTSSPEHVCRVSQNKLLIELLDESAYILSELELKQIRKSQTPQKVNELMKHLE